MSIRLVHIVVQHRTTFSNGLQILHQKIHGQIQQLVLSPREDYLAIVTSHTIYVALLPDPSELDTDEQVLKFPHIWQLGPTAHVLDQAPLASVLWHPLGEKGRCLVTVTRDAVVRLWEVNSRDRSSFQNPTVSIDLKKLANATSASQDLRASTFGAATPFSPDSAELEPAGACFGGTGLSGEDPWSAMTMWVATKEGDAYALCPLLPSKWQVSDHYISSLVLAGVAHAAQNGSGDTDVSRWVLDVADQEPVLKPGNFGAREASLYRRPELPNATPKLQGPYVLIPQPGDEDDEYEEEEPDRTIDTSDIMVIDLGAQQENAFEFEDFADGEDSTQGLPSVVALVNTIGKVHLSLNLDRIEPQWLPLADLDTRLGSGWKLPDPDFRALYTIETVDLQPESKTHMNATFTRDSNSPYGAFVAIPQGIAFFSMESWILALREEMLKAVTDGADVRLNVLLTNYSTLVDYPIEFQQIGQNGDRVVSPIVLKDSDLGYFLLTLANGQPYAATLDSMDEDERSREQTQETDGGMRALPMPEPELREPYQPPQEFFIQSKLPYLTDDMPAHHRNTLRDQVKLSPMSLEVITKAHRTLSEETNAISIAAADLFRRCKRLLEEFQGQIKEIDEVATRVEGLQHGESSDTVLQRRWQQTREKSHDLAERRKKLARRLAVVDQRELSDKEKAFKKEVQQLVHKIPTDNTEGSDDPLWQRLKQLRSLKDGLVKEATRAVDKAKGETKTSTGRATPSEYRKQKIQQVNTLLETEKALIDAVTRRLDNLTPVEA
jgi:nucleoporin NUP82